MKNKKLKFAKHKEKATFYPTVLIGLENQNLKGNQKMIKGRKVYDPLTDTLSTGYWIVNDKGNYYPVWLSKKTEEKMKELRGEP